MTADESGVDEQDARVTFESLLPPRQANEMYELQNRHATILYLWTRAVEQAEGSMRAPVEVAIAHADELEKRMSAWEPLVDTAITPEQFAAAISVGGESEIEVIIAAQRRAVNTLEAEASAFMELVGLGPLIILSDKEEARMMQGDAWDEERWERNRDKLPWEWEVDDDDDLDEGEE